uniref:PknH-like extracellular domain-containing protein n=1 Tax=Streptomyces sp. NBC_00049 TaxID=2903617 RepID=A0AAU2JSI7_9ACTN
MPSPRPVRLALTASAAVLTLLLAGCTQAGGGSGGDPGEEPAIGDVPVLLESRTLTYPLAPYVPDARQLALLSEAQDVLVDQCMRRYGFRYELRRKADPAAGDDNVRRYGVSDAAEAARYGYENPRLNRTTKGPQQTLGPNEQLVLYGLEVDPSLPVPMSQEEAETSDVATTVVGGLKVPAGGCLRESNLKLYAPAKDTVDSTVAQGYGLEAFTRSEKDSRVAKAVSSWSACMAKHGHTMRSPLEQPPGIDDSNASGPQAIATAQQDVGCKKETNLVGVWYTVEVAYQQRGIEQNAETLNTVKKQHEERMRLAASLITTGS